MPEINFEDPELVRDTVDDPNVPDEIARFVEDLGLSDKFRCSVRKRKPGGEGFYNLSDGNNVVPKVEEIGKEYGPGKYTITFTWYPPKGSPRGGGKVGSQIKEIQLDLPERPWARIHRKYVLDQEEADMREENERRLRMQDTAALTHIATRGTAPAGGVESIRDAVSMLKDLGIPVGGVGKPSIDFAAIATLAGTLLPAIIPLFQRKDSLSTTDLITLMQNNQQALIAAMTRRNPLEDNMLNFVNQSIQTAKAVMQLGAPGADRDEEDDKPDMVERIFNLIQTVGPAVIQAIAQKSPEARQHDFMYRAAVGSQELQTLKENPAALAAVVTRLDEKYGCDATDEILSAFSEIGLKRPPETEGNREVYPSPDEKA